MPGKPQKINLFVDTNIYLSFYDFSHGDIEELKKFLGAINNEKIALFITQQVIDEYKRNREGKIKTSLDEVDKKIIELNSFPVFCKSHADYSQLRELAKAYNQQLTKIRNDAIEDASKYSLEADRIISELFSKARLLTSDQQEILKRARERKDIGNPPGKQSKLGDEINWELLLEVGPEDLYIISKDGDYYSPLNLNGKLRIKDFLAEEWRKKKENVFICPDPKIFIYDSASKFFKEHFPEIKLASEFDKEKNELIDSLFSSYSFANTKSIIKELRKYNHFTEAQAKAIVEACLSNDQIYGINTDWICRPLQEFVSTHKSKIEKNRREKFDELFDPEKIVPYGS